MVDEELGRDLLSFGKPILVLGDPAQLPPVKGAGFFTEAAPDVMLTEIHRQARGQPDHPALANHPRGRRDRLRRLRRGAGDPPRRDRRRDGDGGRSGPRRPQQDAARLQPAHPPTSRPRSGLTPAADDKLVCLRNDREKGLLNGGLWRVAEARGMTNDFAQAGARARRRTRAAIRCASPCTGRSSRAREADLPYPIRRESDEFDYGYALTVHKSQGSQWDDVVLFDESRAFREHRARWLYTGVTRAARRLTLVR